MPAQLLSFFRPANLTGGDWSPQEIAEFYRVEAALVQAGVSVFVDKGLTDEGDPWFVFCRASDGEVIVHFARINGNYLIAAESIGHPIKGPEFRRVLSDFAAVHPTLIPVSNSRNAKLMLHPASLLAAIVATALYHMSGTEAVASTIDQSADSSAHDRTPASLNDPIIEADRKTSDWQVAVVVSAMIALAVSDPSGAAKESLSDFVTVMLDGSSDHLVLPSSSIGEQIPTTDLGSSSGKSGILAAQDAHIFVENIALSSGGESLEQQPQINPTDHSTSKTLAGTLSEDALASGPFEPRFLRDDDGGRHSAPRDALTTANEAGLRASEQLISTQSTTASQAAAASDSAHSNPTVGSSSPDHVAGPSDSSSIQSAAILVNFELGTASTNRPTTFVSLTGSLSVQDLISHGLNDVFGVAIPQTLSVLSGGANGRMTASSVATSDLQTSVNSNVISTASTDASTSQSSTQSHTSYQPYDDAASRLINAFVQYNNFEVLTANKDFVLFDTNTADFSSPDLISRTWSMADGSTISIVGVIPHQLLAMI